MGQIHQVPNVGRGVYVRIGREKFALNVPFGPVEMIHSHIGVLQQFLLQTFVISAHFGEACEASAHTITEFYRTFDNFQVCVKPNLLVPAHDGLPSFALFILVKYVIVVGEHRTPNENINQKESGAQDVIVLVGRLTIF
jgi:hypothetical protein